MITTFPAAWADVHGLGARLYWSACASLAIVHLWLGPAIPGLPTFADAGDLLDRGLAFALLAAAGSALLGVRRWWSTAASAIVWATASLAALATAFNAPGEVTRWVAFGEAVIFGAMSLTLLSIGHPRAERPADLCLRLIAALLLLLFGAVHLAERQALASIVPAWLPARTVWPTVTGLLQLLLGVALLVPSTARAGALLAAGLFLSWLPLVHLERLNANPDSAFEWAFALVALGLASIMLYLGRGGAGRD